jgi:tRNA threonylcarbamoyladenosine biosynthesis protein TsaB
MSVILNIDSSTTMCSVGIGVDGKCIDFLEINDGYSHAEKLAPFVDELLRKNSITIATVDAVAVGKGPGSYTGLRIGVSLAKGLCFAHNKPLIAVSTLQMMCLHPAVREQLNFFKDMLLCPMLDARRMEVYTAIYDVGLMPLMETEAKILEEDSYSEWLNKELVLFFGNGAEKFKSLTPHSSAKFVDEVWPSAQYMTGLSQMKFEQSEFEDLAYFEPYYLKEFMGTAPKKLV